MDDRDIDGMDGLMDDNDEQAHIMTNGAMDDELENSPTRSNIDREEASKMSDLKTSEDSDNNSEEEEDDDDEDVAAPPPEGMYDPSDYEYLNVSSDIKEIFNYIVRYTPQTIEIETRFKPFIPEYIPAVGDIDAFLKVNRPDDKKETLGLTVLDEPSAKQSDPSVLDLQLRAVMKQSAQKSVVIKKIESGEKNSKAIDKWIKDISDLHRSKPPPTVHYNKPMPDLDQLMQEWPLDFENLLKTMGGIPDASLQCDLRTYVDVMCALLDIPIYKSRIQSLHVLFSLFSVFKQSQHFNMLNQ